MKTIPDLERSLTFIHSQLRPAAPARSGPPLSVRCVTISRESGCGAHTFAEKLAVNLQTGPPPDPMPWTIFDSGLIEAVLQDHHLPARLASFMPEDKASQVNDIIEDLFGLHPPAETLMRQISETILRLAQLGHTIIVGRGGNVITARLPGMLHIRLVGSLEQRIAHMQRFDQLGRPAALQRIEREDGGRRRYLRKYFHKDVEDPLLYHCVINTDQISLEDAARMVAALAQNRKSPCS